MPTWVFAREHRKTRPNHLYFYMIARAYSTSSYLKGKIVLISKLQRWQTALKSCGQAQDY